MNANSHQPRTTRRLLVLVALCCVAGMAGCNQEMRNDSRLKPYEPSPVFADGRSSRPLVAGTVPHSEQPPGDPSFLTGFNADGQPIAELPMPVTKELLERGRERFNIYCSVCHGEDGAGQGIIVRRGFPAPPSYHIDRLRRAPVGHIYDVITNGYGIMYSYKDRLRTPEDRWAVAAYVRALQYSQFASVQDLPPDQASKIQGAQQ